MFTYYAPWRSMKDRVLWRVRLLGRTVFETSILVSILMNNISYYLRGIELMQMVRKIVEFPFFLQKELKRMTDADGEG